MDCVPPGIVPRELELPHRHYHNSVTERAYVEELRFEAARLRRSCKRLVWLNPLLGYRDFQPRARGVRVLLPAVHEHRAAHNVDSLLGLAAALEAC